MPQTIESPVDDNLFGELASPIYAESFHASNSEPDFGDLASPLGENEARAVEVSLKKNPPRKSFVPGTYDAEGPVPSVPYGPFTPGPVGSGMLQAGQDIGSVLARFLPMGATGDDFQHAAANVDAEREAAGEGMVGNLVRGGVRSLMPMVVTSKLGLPSAAAPAAPIAVGSAIQGSQSLTQARDEGLPEGKARQFALQSALVEGGMEAVASRFGPSIENVISRGIAKGLKPRQALIIGAKALGIDAGQEVATEAAHVANEWLSSVSEDEHTPSAIAQRLLLAAAQSAILTGGVTGTHLGLSVVERPGRLVDAQQERAVRQEERTARQSQAQREAIQNAPPPATPVAADSNVTPPIPADGFTAPQDFGKSLEAQPGERERKQFDQLAADAREQELASYREFYGSPASAADYARRYPEQAKAIVASKSYRVPDFQKVDPDLPELSGTPEDATLRRQWKNHLTQFVNDPQSAELVVQSHSQEQLPQNQRDPRAWQRLPDGVPLPANPAIEVRETDGGKFFRFNPAAAVVPTPAPSNALAEQAKALADFERANPDKVPPKNEDRPAEMEWDSPPPTQTSKPEPPTKPGMVRLYHSGNEPDGNPRWVSTSKDYAANYRPDLPLHYIDVPASDPRVNNPDYPDQGPKHGFTFNFELTPAEAARLAKIQRTPAEEATAKIQEKRIDIPDVKPAETPAIPPVATNPHAGVVGKIGENSKGQKLYQDENGVRSRIEDGVRVTEPVQLVPSRQGIKYQTDRTNSNEWLTTEEMSAEQTPTTKPAETPPIPARQTTPELEDTYGPDADVQTRWTPVKEFKKFSPGDVVSVDRHDGSRVFGVVRGSGSNFADIQSNGRVTREFNTDGVFYSGRRVQRAAANPTPTKKLLQPSAKPENADVTEGLRRAETYYGQKIETVSPSTTDEHDAADFLKERGYTPVFVRPTDGSKLRARGMAHGKAVFIRSGTTGNALWEAVGHEIAHASGFDKRGSDIDEKLIADAADRHASRVSEQYRERMANDPALRRREGIATLVGEFLANDAFRNQVNRESPSLWQRIADAVLALFAKSSPNRDAARAVLDLLEKRPEPTPTKSLLKKSEPASPKVDFSKASEADIEAALLKEMMGEQPAAESPAPPAPTKPTESPPKKRIFQKKPTPAPTETPKPTIKERAQTAREEYQAALDEAAQAIRDAGLGMNQPLNPKVAAAVVKVAAKGLKAGVLTFADFANDMAQVIGRDKIPKLRAYLTKAWDAARKIDQSGKVEAADYDQFFENYGKEEAAPVAARDYGTIENPNRIALSEHFGKRLAAGAAYPSITDARKEAGTLLGGTVEPGTQAAKHVDEAVEAGVVKAAQAIAERSTDDAATFDELLDLYQRQPNLAVRTSTSIVQQAYSTPAPLAWLTNVLANVQPTDVVYDSSAGNGMLLIGAKHPMANELNRERAAVLRSQGIPTTNRDATTYRPEKPVDAVIINPPFGAVTDEIGRKSWNIGGLKTDKVDHAIVANTLPAMKDDGRAVLIIGSKGFEAGDPKADMQRATAYLGDKAFYDHVWDDYNVVDHFTVAGDLYARQGAKFPIDVIVIDGKGASSLPKPYNFKAGGLPNVISSWGELKDEQLKRLATGGRATGVEPSGSRSGDTATPGGNPNNLAGVPGQAQDQGAVDVKAPAKPGKRFGERVGQSGRGNADAQTAAGSGGQSGLSGRPAGATQPATKPVSNAGEQRSEPATRDAGSRPANVAPGNRPETRRLTQPSGDAETEHQVSYRPGSHQEGVGTLVPKTQATAIEQALDNIISRRGDIDQFVARELGYKSEELGKHFSAEQIDALAMIIDKQQEGKAFILGDQTGVGKGRVAAGMIHYAKKNGMVPIFVTEKPDLFRDLLRDLGDIGMNKPNDLFEPLATNDLSGNKVIHLPDGRTLKQTSTAANRRLREATDTFLKSGELKAGNKEYGAIFTTYSQMQPIKQALADRHHLLKTLAPEAFFILDESHNAGGSGQLDEKGQKNSRDQDEETLTRASFIRELIEPAKGVTFLSATFAKRPEVMDLYAKTGISDAVESTDKLASAIKYGGVPLQQAVSEMLSEGGVYLRRERSFDGVDFAPKVASVSLETADNVSSIYRAINKFDQAKQDALENEDNDIEGDLVSGGGKMGNDTATGDAGISSTNFSSILWNLTDQMLMALKADVAAQEAIESWKRGETPVIVVDNTLESGLNYYLDDNPTEPGQPIDFTFRDLLSRYLDRSRQILVKHDVTDPKSWEQIRLTDEQLGEEGVKRYEEAKRLIDDFTGDLPASPIDWMRSKMQQAGMKISEVTGRKSIVQYQPNGQMTLEHRPESEIGSEGKVATVDGLNAGTVDAVILNRSGATGISMHASSKFKNQKMRHMIIAQSAKNIDEFMQMLGRVHRTGQVRVPRYTLLMSNVPAETRPAAVLVKKLSSLNANVTASAKGSVSFDVPDVINQIGDRIIADYMAENPELNDELNKPVEVSDRTGRAKMVPGIAKKVTGRIVLMPVEVQQQFWDDVIQAFDAEIEELDRTNQNPLAAKTLPISATTIESFPIFQGDPNSDSPFLQPGIMEKVRAKKLGESMKPDEVRARINSFYGKEPTASTARQWEGQQRQKAADYLRTEATKRLEKTDDPDKRKEIEARFSQQLARFNSAMENIAPGQNIRVMETGDGQIVEDTTGIVIGVTRKGTSKNIASLSSWVAEVALPTPDRILRIPLSRIGGLDPSSITEGDSNTYVDAMRSFAREEDYDAFAQPQSTHESRFIGTGNILAAAGELVKHRGRVVFFTDEKGDTRRGVLMPRNFQGEKWAKDRPVVFRDADQIYRFLTQQGGSYVVTPDKALAIRHDDGKFVFTAPKSKQKGGKYTTNAAVLNAASPDEFVSVGQRMEMTLPKAKAKAVIQAILDVSPLQTDSHKLEARGIVDEGELPQSMKSPRKAASLATLPRQTRSTDVTATSQQSIAAADIIKTWERLFGVPIRTGGFANKRAAGIYKILPETVRIKEKHYADLAIASHEIAHHIDKQTSIAGADSRTTPQIPDHLQGEVRGMDYEPKNRLFEGFAEFIRHYITENDAQLLAPEFHDWFENIWMPAHTKEAKALKEAKSHARQYADQTVLQRVRSAIGRPGDDLSWIARMKQRASKFGRWFVRAWIDRASPLKAIQDEAAARGADYSQKAGVYDLFMAYDMTAEANAAQALETGVHALTDGRKLSESLWGLAKELRNDVEREEAVAYAWARHTLHEHAAKPGYNTGLDVEDADRIVQYVESDLDKYERYEKVATGFAQYANGTLDLLVDAGALAPEARDRIVERYGDYYFPLLRVRDEFAGLPTGGARIVNLPKSVLGRSSKGSGRAIMDPFDSLVALTIQRYSRAVKARVAQSLAETLDPRLGGVEGMGGLMDRVEPRRVVHEGTVEEILKSLVEDGVVEPDDARAMKIARQLREGGEVSGRNQEWFAKRHGLAESVSLLETAESEPDVLSTISLWRNDFTPSAKKATVVIHDREGNPVLYEMDRELYNTATGMDGLQFGAFANFLRSATSIFKAGAVGISTGFGVTNLVRDYLEYQGRAENVKGTASLGKPVEMIGRYIGYKARQIAGKPTDNALIETFEAAGGKLFTRLGSDIATRQRTRQRRLGQSRGVLESPWHVKDAVQSAGEGLQDVIAWTDAPPRLAEMEAMGRQLGFEARGGDWYSIDTGEKTNLPEYARIKMLNAAAEATVNFKRAGSVGRVVDAFVPFWNATLQASYREARQIGSMRGLFGKSDDNRERALRYLVYLAAAASTGWITWLLRHDDDDYREQEPWLKEGFWTWGQGGKTYLRIPKPRDLGGLVASLMEASLDAWHHDDADGAVAGVLERHAMSRLPDGGGPLRAAVETLVADYDYFKDRPLTPDYLKDDPKALQFTPYTLETSKAIGKVAAPTLGLSPIQVEHLLNGSSGGAYRRWADTAEAAYEGRLGPEHIPFVRGMVLNRHQARSLDDFYTDWNRLKLAAKWETAQGEVSSETASQKARLDDYASLMSEIRSLDKRDMKGRRKFLYEPMLVGLAREALEREPLEANPSPFNDPKLPDEAKAAVVEFSTRKAKSVLLSQGMPVKAHKGDENYEDTFAKWKAGRDADAAWLNEHESSPYVQEAIASVQGGKGYRGLLRREGRPQFNPRQETVEEHQQDVRRFNEKLENARQWRGG